MNDALYIAATGMHVQQKSVETIANNLANVNTPGFKKGRVSFEDLVYRDMQAGATADLRLGSGVAMGSVLKSFVAGELKKTDQALDLAIQGEGFLEAVGQDGAPVYLRGGTLTINPDGLLATAGGAVLKPAVHVGIDARDVLVRADGTVLARANGQGAAQEVGRLELVRFANPQGLFAAGANMYRPSERSGEAQALRPGEDGAGSFAQGYLEGSNVKLVEEMVDLMVAQRAYESSVKLIQATDELMAMSNNLRK